MVLSALQEGALWSMIGCSINHRCPSPRTTGSCPSCVRARDEEGGGATLSSVPAASRLHAEPSLELETSGGRDEPRTEADEQEEEEKEEGEDGHQPGGIGTETNSRFKSTHTIDIWKHSSLSDT